jgi:iron(III) transport system permease protein
VLALRVAIAFVAALFIAWANVRFPFPGRRFVEISLWLAFFLPTVPIAMAWIVLLHKDYGLINTALATIPFFPKHFFSIHSIPGIMWIYLTIGTVPFLSIIFTPLIRQMDASFEEAGRVHGATRRQSAFRITLPMLLPALLVGLMAAFIRGLESFEVEQLVGTPARIFVFTTRIYDLVRQEPPLLAQALALGTIFLLITIVLAIAQLIYNRGRPGVVTVRSQGFRLSAAAGRRVKIGLAIVVIGYVLISIYLPLAVVVLGSFNKIFGFFQMPQPWTLDHWHEVLSDVRFLPALWHSVLLGFGIAALALPLYLRLAWIVARTKVVGRRIASLLLWLPWAVPGFVLGFGLLDMLLRSDWLAPFYGTFAPVVAALVVREMPVGVQMLKSSIEQTGRELEEAALVAGAGRVYAFARITLRLLSPSLVAVFIIVLAAVIKEISTIVLVAGPGVQTLSLLMFDYATNGRSESAAVVGVIFASVSVVLALLASRRALPVDPP